MRNRVCTTCPMTFLTMDDEEERCPSCRLQEATEKLKLMRQSFGSIGILVRSCESLCRDVDASKLALLLEGPLAAMKQIVEEEQKR